MKTEEFLRILRKCGARFDHHGTRHDVWEKDGVTAIVPRHKTIKRDTARGILKDLGIKIVI